MRRIAPRCQAAAVPEPPATSPGLPTIDETLDYVKFVVPLAALVTVDKVLAAFLAAQGVTFPAPIIGMFGFFGALLALEKTAPAVNNAIIDFFQPAVQWLTRWLPLFFVPSLVTLPLAVQSLSTAEVGKLLLILLPGWALSCAVTGAAVQTVRSFTRTSLLPYTPSPAPPPFSAGVRNTWVGVALAGFALCAVSPLALGSVAMTAAPPLIACTVLGYVVGTALPAAVKSVVHPVLTTALFGELGCALYGMISGMHLTDALTIYKTGSLMINPGAGDIFMGFLGSVILSFAFSMYSQRALMKRHWREIFGSVGMSSVFSLFSTAALGKLLGLGPALTMAVVPRCITVAIALPMADMLGVADPSLTAAAVVLTGLIGANFGQKMLDMCKFDDPITRGIATAGSSHGLGTAAIAPKEPETLPFCAIAQALTGIACSRLVAVPAVRIALLAIAS